MKINLINRSSTIAILALSALVSACSNHQFQEALTSSSTSNATSGSDSTTSKRFKISSVTISAAISSSSSSSSGSGSISILFDTTASESILASCDAASSSGTSTSEKTCYCQLSWTEKNTQGTTTSSYTRTVTSPVTVVQNAAVSCATPTAYGEILPNTSISVKVIPATLTMDSYSYVKGSTTASGAFQDAQGRTLANILRYSCYSQTVRGMTIKSRMGSKSLSSPANETKTFPLANQFCVRRMKTGTNPTATAGCESLDLADYSAQSYYYNLYIREGEVGDINPGNSGFVCPVVSPPLNYYAASNPSKYWPLDATFALSVSKSQDYNLGVVARSKTSNANDPTTGSSSCESSSTTSSSSSSGSTTTSKPTILSSCLGFAAKPNTDGSCPVIGNKQTYRLRRYVALYPAFFDTNGAAVDMAQATDYVYVLDRPVYDSANPNSVITMLGPKPCPFSYFDRKGVAYDNGVPRYVATNDSQWTGRNVDGIALPNVDSATSCAAALPLVNTSKTAVSVTTVNLKNPIYRNQFIRPIQAWAPHYEEDIEFQACAPRADPFRDPPLHFMKSADSTKNVAWCAEAYPTQNDNVASLDAHQVPTDAGTAYTGNTAPFTSHVKKNTIDTSASTTCLAKTPVIPSNPAYPAGGKALHPNTLVVDSGATYGTSDKTCDRTVVNPLNGASWPRFPLLAPPSDVESAISKDSSYQCTFTSGTSVSGTPSKGCCGLDSNTPIVNVPTGAAGNSSAHLEPERACGTPVL